MLELEGEGVERGILVLGPLRLPCPAAASFALL